MQTKDRGKHDILPVAGDRQDHALVPVTLPRPSDADMRRDGSAIPQRVQIPTSMSAEECTAHQDSMSGPISPQAARTRSRRGRARLHLGPSREYNIHQENVMKTSPRMSPIKRAR